MSNKLTISDVAKKDLKIVAYLVVSGVLGFAISKLADQPELIVVVTPAINYVLYRINKELDNEGYVKALKQ
ncbi:hypothetical protein KBC79_01535 [Candidatus Woesebacteria bacterium]|nr:hypothetical protein [Candidatus Woesebacteria bacterium]